METSQETPGGAATLGALKGPEDAGGSQSPPRDLARAGLDELHRLVVETAEDGIWIIDAESKTTFVNQKMASMLGFTVEEMLGQSLFMFMDDEGRRIAEINVERRRRGIREQHDFRFRRRDGRDLWAIVATNPLLDSQGNYIGALAVITDISERRRTEESQIRASRLEAAATLAAGIAHDFNNLMVSVLGNAEMLRMDFADNAEAAEMLGDIVGTARRASDLAQQMLAFAHGGKCSPAVTDVNEMVLETLRLRASAFPPRIELIRDLQAGLWPIEADRSQLTQVLTNLCVNACEAMSGGGRLTVRTRNVEPGQAPRDLPGPLGSADLVAFAVEDTGAGMDPETLLRVFEPFFSTKFSGRGLGLAVTHGIVKNHGGHVAVQSERGHGSCFTVYLPALRTPAAKPRAEEGASRRGRETILVIDDEETVLSVTRRILGREGYRVICARSATEALALLSSEAPQVDLAMLDLGMPDMGGAEVFPLLRQRRPQMKIILHSGCDLNHASEVLLDAGASAFLQKPFRAADLTREIRRALDEP
jgi:two-component system cell cycle sensor histidine kinase/response regulator CckA